MLSLPISPDLVIIFDLLDMPWNMRRVDIQPLLKGIRLLIFRMFHRMLEDFIGLFLEQSIGRLADEPHNFERVFIALLMVIQFRSPLILIIAHYRAAGFDDQFARTEGRI